jgi:hypothetical protein
MVRIDTTVYSRPRDAGRRSQPVPLREIIAEIQAVLEKCQEGWRGGLATQVAAAAGAARPAR